MIYYTYNVCIVTSGHYSLDCVKEKKKSGNEKSSIPFCSVGVHLLASCGCNFGVLFVIICVFSSAVQQFFIVLRLKNFKIDYLGLIIGSAVSSESV